MLDIEKFMRLKREGEMLYSTRARFSNLNSTNEKHKK